MKRPEIQAFLLVTAVAACGAAGVSAQEGRGLRLAPNSGPTYPGTAGLPTRNVNDANYGGNAPMLSGPPAQILQQNFPVPVKGSDADTYMPQALLERAQGPLVEPKKEIHLY